MSCISHTVVSEHLGEWLEALPVTIRPVLDSKASRSFELGVRKCVMSTSITFVFLYTVGTEAGGEANDARFLEVGFEGFHW